MKTIQPLRNNWRIDEDMGFIPDQIKERVDSEDWYTHCKGFPIIKEKDLTGRIGQPIK